MNSKHHSQHNAEITVFGENGPELLKNVRTVIREVEHAKIHYKYTSIEEHQAILQKNRSNGIRIQTIEILNHAHFAAVATLVRAYRWAEGCLAAFSQNLFLPFCASARGLLEAVGDSYDALPRVPLSLAENHLTIKNSLNGKLSRFIINWKEIEDVLLHFSHARRIENMEKCTAPDYAVAKLSNAYIKPLEGFPPGNFYDWYQELCEL